MKNILDFSVFPTTYTYDQLSPEAKETARKEVILHERQAYSELKARIKDSIFDKKINRLVNTPHISNLRRLLGFCNKLEKDINCCEKTILSNLCHFLENGEYLLYITKTQQKYL